MIVFAGSSSKRLGREVAEDLGCELGRARLKRFPDGELYVKVESEVAGMHAVVVQSTCRPQDENLLELLLLSDALRDLGARVTAVVPYYGYGRQDRAFERGEAVSARTVARHLELSAERFLTVNPHKGHILSYFTIPARAVDAAPLIGMSFRGRGRSLVVAPDSGAKALAEGVARALGCRCDYCDKKRLGPGRVVSSAERLSVKGEDVLIVDDIIDSGGTIVETAREIRERGANSVAVACVHPVLTGDAAERVLAVAEELVATNTIETRFSRISVASLIAEELRSW